jgi:hypothetical protein
LKALNTTLSKMPGCPGPTGSSGIPVEVLRGLGELSGIIRRTNAEVETLKHEMSGHSSHETLQKVADELHSEVHDASILIEALLRAVDPRTQWPNAVSHGALHLILHLTRLGQVLAGDQWDKPDSGLDELTLVALIDAESLQQDHPELARAFEELFRSVASEEERRARLIEVMRVGQLIANELV